MTIISEKLVEKARAMRAKSLAQGPFVVGHRTGRYILTPTQTPTGEFYWVIVDREGEEHRFLGNSRAAVKANFLSWLEN